MSNPFLSTSTLPYQLPPWKEITPDDFLPAFKAGFEEQLAEIDAILANPQAPDFTNTVAAMELAGQTLARTASAFFTLTAADATDQVQAIQQEVGPQLAAHEDSIYLNKALWARLEAVSPEGLDAESARLLDEYRRSFIRAGARLDDDGQARMRELNSRLSVLGTDYAQKLLRDTNDSALLLADAAELDGLSADDVASAAAAAAEAGAEGSYLLSLVLPTSQPALASLTNRETRRRLLEASLNRGFRDNDDNTLALAAEMAALRAERAALLGFANLAEFATDNQTAPSLDAIHSMLDQLAPPAVRNARAEAELLREAARRDGIDELAAWDWSYYSEQVRREKFSVDRSALRPYFELERVLNDGVFYAANRLYGLTFTERPDLTGYHPDVRVWEVKNDDGSALGLFLGDYYTRDTKAGGAWMNSLVHQSALLGTQAVVINNLNIPKPPAGEPTLLSFDEVVTAFHEFGHALHGLFSDVTYPQFSGTAVPRDFVEYPSQVNEMWMLWPEVVANFARHHVTGEPLPQETIDKIEAASTWGEGFGTTEYLGSALLDLAWHELAPGETVADPQQFEADALSRAGVALDLVPPRYRSGYFKHIFAGGYAASYYAYIWSEVLDADTVEWFKENGGLTRENGDRFRLELLARGNSIDPLQAFRNFRGREAAIEPLLHRRGLA
ncbi:M3 family metallopeptidase [Arthrobacter sp. zg-Y820]|uniref:M3 family metallopeptidase n=1 Tax=unclassified Arthrobacter TaxID=235627 RepID=UPI001E306C71|nr:MULTISPECIES: M3 family metallopeptidase [unclassified Arthrobacter]MCC9196390.1 M3 family metallopeptidase [Arthrobacter sp. zg-Y820]MDK1279252.1 M3 family metallopeptidase [Arthrobacter sp. zg.Y820]WIB08351.1 M3 family metallopeptidase [Arthrobacter sp. zg-Y820]